jgi:membrane fusion protein, copper/silver efflux system
MKTKYSGIRRIALLLLILIALAATGFIVRQNRIVNLKEETLLSKKKQYVCSMHPQVLRDVPGDCPICGMLLIEKIEQDKNASDASLNDIVLPVNESVLGSVTIVTPEQTVLPLVIEASGIINYDPRKIKTISARFGGLIERSFVKYQFQHIRNGQKIFEIYCPDIYTPQWNYVKLIQAYPDQDDLTMEALEWFKLLGLSKGQIDSLKRSAKPDFHLAVYSYAEGYAVSRDFDPETFFFTGIKGESNPETFLAGTGNIGLNDGVIVETGTPLFKLIDVNSLRVDLKVKTEDGSLLRTGQKVIITDAANPDRQFSASIDQIDPLNGGLFQSVKVYVADNERILLPGRQIKASILAGSRNGLWVPVTSVIDMGQHRSVFVFNENRFVATEVRTGVRSKDKIEILTGINENSKIAEKALLLTDSDGFIDTNKKDSPE